MSDRRRAAFVPGLEGVVATETRLSSVDGEAGALIIAGFPVGELASRATAEEWSTCYGATPSPIPDN